MVKYVSWYKEIHTSSIHLIDIYTLVTCINPLFNGNGNNNYTICFFAYNSTHDTIIHIKHTGIVASVCY